MKRALFLAGLGVLSLAFSSQLSRAESAPGGTPVYRDYGAWRSGAFGGGGFLQNIIFAPSDPRMLYTYVDVGGLYRSADGGRTWRMLHGSLPARDGAYSVRGLAGFVLARYPLAPSRMAEIRAQLDARKP